MTSRRPQLMVSILSALVVVALGLLFAREATGTQEYLFGAYGALGASVLLGFVVALSLRSGVDPEATRFVPSGDDLKRVMTINVAPPAIAESVFEQQVGESAPATSVNRAEPLNLAESPDTSIEVASATNVGVGPTVLSPSAEAFVNIGRRNKQLNRQMLTLISHLERDELDPEVLHGLYELDHLATRMRRNEETLLLLASTRRVRQWSPPVALENVLRSALAEVEKFSRVEIDEVPDVEVLGEAVGDITHLLAELIDNATEFSHASTLVTVSAHTTLEGIEIEVLDTGHGMDQEKLEALNLLLAEPPTVDDAPSRRLGLFIAAQIASCMPIDVALTGERGVGTVATVSVANELLVEVDDIEDDETLLDTIDLFDPVMQLAVGAELEQDEEDELAIASLPSDEDFADVIASLPAVSDDLVHQPGFPTVEPVAAEPDGVTAVVAFPSVSSVDVEDVAQALPSRIPQATFESVWGDESRTPMPVPGVAQIPVADQMATEFDDDAAQAAADGAGSSITAFTGGVARGLAQSAQDLPQSSPNESAEQ